MSENKEFVARLTLDFSRSLIRIYRNTLRALGFPAYIQFLINPEDLYIAILGSERPMSGGTANKVKIPKDRLDSKRSLELNSASLLNRISDVFGELDRNYNYHLYGEVDKVNRVAYFSMLSLQKVERRKSNDGEKF